jgi:hypothetical protein
VKAYKSLNSPPPTQDLILNAWFSLFVKENFVEQFWSRSSKRLLFFFVLGGVGPSPLLLRPLDGLFYQLRMMINDDECGTIRGMIGRVNRSTRRKPAPVPFCPSQIPYDLIRVRILAAAVGYRRLTALATAQPQWLLSLSWLHQTPQSYMLSMLLQSTFFKLTAITSRACMTVAFDARLCCRAENILLKGRCIAVNWNIFKGITSVPSAQ